MNTKKTSWSVAMAGLVPLLLAIVVLGAGAVHAETVTSTTLSNGALHVISTTNNNVTDANGAPMTVTSVSDTVFPNFGSTGTGQVLGVSTSNPGLPNTGAGGEVSLIMSMLILSVGTIGAGVVYFSRKFVS